MADTTKPNSILTIFRYERIRRIVAWLTEHQDELSKPDMIQIVFDCAGKKVKATKAEREEI